MRQITYVQAINEALREEMLRDERVFYMGEGVGITGGSFGTTVGLLREFGEARVRETPISEAAIVGFAIGAALGGLHPVAEIGSHNWIYHAMDMICNHAAKLTYMSGGRLPMPVVVRSHGGATPGSAAQHAQFLAATFMHFPGLKVVAAATPYDVKGLTKAAIRGDNPVLLLDHRLNYGVKGEVPEEDYTLPFGKAEIKRLGKNVTLVAISHSVHHALAAAEQLAQEGIEAEVVDPRTLVPLDTKTIIDSVVKTGRLVIAEPGWRSNGVGAEIAAIVADQALDCLDAPIKRVAMKGVPVPFDVPLMEAVAPNAEDIAEAVRSLFQ
ncbi:MAG: alpha-ketoacid dehydrogenase subunit beta [Chloroflexi bacterium]|nr:alpha-ketoacid dehydrogenase subunit beta [Chloroflexota bacterium]